MDNFLYKGSKELQRLVTHVRLAGDRDMTRAKQYENNGGRTKSGVGGVDMVVEEGRGSPFVPLSSLSPFLSRQGGRELTGGTWFTLCSLPSLTSSQYNVAEEGGRSWLVPCHHPPS